MKNLLPCIYRHSILIYLIITVYRTIAVSKINTNMFVPGNIQLKIILLIQSHFPCLLNLFPLLTSVPFHSSSTPFLSYISLSFQLSSFSYQLFFYPACSTYLLPAFPSPPSPFTPLLPTWLPAYEWPGWGQGVIRSSSGGSGGSSNPATRCRLSYNKTFTKWKEENGRKYSPVNHK